mgnify:CR=1 FL=1
MLLHEAIVGLITTEHNDTCSALPCSKTFYWSTDKKFRKKNKHTLLNYILWCLLFECHKLLIFESRALRLAFTT